ncbi:MAG: hypothetical protein HOW73_17040 [Polyangiaceae bacterium]|nr:hypothetical protein [Polyangiaceae bacterium]
MSGVAAGTVAGTAAEAAVGDDPSGVGSAAGSSLRPRLTTRQLALVSAITKSASLKRRLIDATEALHEGAVVRIGEEAARLGPVIGSGLVGVVHRATLEETARVVAVKRARARLAFFREAFRVERRTAAKLADRPELGCARIVAFGDHFLAKELVTGPTLAELLVRSTIDRVQRVALEAVLDVVRHGLDAWQIALDVSPKNLAWDGRWVLLDAGPKMKVGDVARIADARSFDAYVRAYRAKLADGPSAPSAVAAPASAEEKLSSPGNHVFVRDFWRWFPLDEDVDVHSFLVDPDEAMSSDEIAVERLASGDFVPAQGLPPAVLDSAVAAWANTEPASRAVALASIARSATGRLHRVLNAAELPIPTVSVRPYHHYRDVLEPSLGHSPLDLYCHEVMPAGPGNAPSAANTSKGALTRLRIPTPPGTFAELGYRRAPSSNRAYVLVPGFRAGIDAATPLVRTLIERGHRGCFLAARLGVRNAKGQPLVTGGVWEVPLLVQVVDYAVTALDVSAVTLIAASHGAAAAMDVAAIHPAVDRLVLDSPLERPLELFFHAASFHDLDRNGARDLLRAHDLPFDERVLDVPSRSGLRSLALRPSPDRITDVCGFAGGASRVVEYRGPHAATMRHDVSERGIPVVCLEAIDAFHDET